MATATSNKSAARKAETKLFPTRNDLPEDARRQLVGLLNGVLSDLSDLTYSTRERKPSSLTRPRKVGINAGYPATSLALGSTIDSRT